MTRYDVKNAQEVAGGDMSSNRFAGEYKRVAVRNGPSADGDYGGSPLLISWLNAAAATC